MPPRSTKGLTTHQRAVLDWIKGFIAQHGIPPTVREIGSAFGIKSSSAFYLLKELERKGMVERGRLGARSLVVTQAAEEIGIESVRGKDMSTKKARKTGFWTHPSVHPFASTGDPVAIIEARAQGLALDAMEGGWEGPPFDTFQLANLLGFEVIPCESIRDARLVPVSRDRYRIEYNPNQPRARIRFSIAHEIIHTIFPDCRERIRNRIAKQHMADDDWQLEMLCNIGAAELLMPMGSFPYILESEFSIDPLLRLRERFQVSTEAILLRFVRLARIPCAVFAASRQSLDRDTIRVDYAQSANEWGISLPNGFEIPSGSVVYECRAIGYTAKGDETWSTDVGEMRVECVAVPSYPGADNPRVIGLLSPTSPHPLVKPTINYLVGDATEPRGDGVKIIAHVVNNGAPRWGAGFARVLGKKWPAAQDDFVAWVAQDKSRLTLDGHRLFRIDDELLVFHMIAQHGYGSSSKPRIRYRALEACLRELLAVATDESATVHMPRIGCGQAGGSWPVVSELIDSILCRKGIQVTVYDLPSERQRWTQPSRQQTLFDEPVVI